MSCHSEKQRFTDISSANLSFCGETRVRSRSVIIIRVHRPVRSAKVQLSQQKLSHYSLITACICSHLIWLFWSLICTCRCLWFSKYRWRRLMFVITAWFLFHSVCSELIRGISYCSRSGRKVQSVLHSWTSHLNQKKPWFKHDTF